MAPRGREPLRPSLPSALLEQLGVDGAQSSSLSSPRRGQFQTSRKERRKQERIHKRQRTATVQKRTPAGRPTARTASSTKPTDVSKKTMVASFSHKHKQKPAARDVLDDEIDDDFGGFSADDVDEEKEGDDGIDSFESDNEDGDNDDGYEDTATTTVSNTSKVVKEKLAKEDAEIAALERKLGIKNRKSLPKSFEEDGLGDLLGDLGAESDGDDDKSEKRKRKAEADEWLAQKRRKALHKAGVQPKHDTGEDSDGLAGLGEDDEDLSSEDLDLYEDDEDQDDNSDDYGSDDMNDEEEVKPVKKRENPYVAPVAATAQAQKYVPPARRQATGSDAELLLRIRRQTQGLINRLTESNLLAILGDIEKLYRDYPRQHVTSILVDILLTQICEPTSLPDTLLILTAGFSTAVYQVIGPDFGAQLVQQTVDRFQFHFAQVSGGDAQNVPKHTSNLITFLSEIYNFQLIRCNLIFDYIRLLLSNLSEHNAELLLRIVRMAGQSLRRDDPLALKDIVSLIGPAVKKIGEGNLSVRTKFMIESINDLKNNKVKTGASATAVVQDHMTRMKKLLGSMQTRKLKATEPLRIGLKDIQESDKRGKWWLVGASWAGRDEAPKKQVEAAKDGRDDTDNDDLSSDDEDVMPDLAAIGKENGMNTDVRLSIFIAIMSAYDYEDAYNRLSKLRLNKDRQKEIAYVLIQCTGMEQQYNPYYALVARKVCGDGRIKFALQDSLWKFLRRLGEPLFGEDADEDDVDTIDSRRIFGVAKMFGFLLAHGALSLSILKCLDLAYVRPKTRDLLEVMLMVMILELRKAKTEVETVFASVADMPELSKGLQYFLRKRVAKSDLFANKKDSKRVKKACRTAIKALDGGVEAATETLDMVDLDEDED
ncbi:hypothetical protein BD289DRAFT_260078 [Coniella lustricola]|uniref:MI domain-containing protein n=1 Tax=Coniella lustricola TaxID=2025994 RepID=A0A2T3A811_9PEZI|nr:hypothetical protein BD289DRAFT_260078 [Coniella lustricola]